jgi:tetratricopeptide (TPR) repeat protein
MKTRKPALQRTIEAILWTISGMQALSGLCVFLLFKNLHYLITLKVVLLIGIGELLTYFTLWILCKRRKLKWTLKSGEMITITKIGRRPLFAFFGGWLLLTAIAVNNLFQDQRPPATFAAQMVRQPVFNSDDRRFKILILPWETECEYQGKKYNIGRVLQKTINTIALPDDVRLHTYYLADSINYSNFTDRTADSLMRYHRANMIVYGAYSLKECEGGTTDKIYFNYLTDNMAPHLCQIDIHTGYSMVSFDGLDDIRKGTGHTEIAGIARRLVAAAEMRLGNFAAAVNTVREIKGFWLNKDVLFLAGTCYYYIKDNDNAANCYQQILRIDSSYTEASLHLGVTLAAAGKRQEGRTYLQQVLDRDINNISALRNVALISLSMQDTLTARTCVERIEQQKSAGGEHVLAVIGNLRLKLRDYKLAKTHLERSLALHKHHAERWADLAMAYQGLKDTSTALKYLHRAVQINPLYADGWYQMGTICERGRRFSEAQANFQLAVNADPRNARAMAYLGKSYYFFSHQKAKGLEYVNKAIEISPKDYLIMALAIPVFRDAKLYPQARKYLESIIANNPDVTVALLNDLGIIYGQLEDYGKALDCFKQTLKAFPPNPATYYNLASTYSNLNNKQEALSYLKKAMDQDTTIRSRVKRDSSFSWLRGSPELCQILQ